MSDHLSENLQENQSCPTIGYQSASICIPITVTPFVKTGATLTTCCGKPVVSSGINTNDGIKNGACTFTISQDICIAVPVGFGAVALAGDTFVNCKGASDRDIDIDCKKIVELTNPIN